jgi:hypothetical protein
MEFNWVMLLVGYGLVFGGFCLGRLTMLLRVINNPIWTISMISKHNENVKMDKINVSSFEEIEEFKATLKAMRDSRGE